MATSNEDSSIPTNKILTSSGMFDNKIENVSELLGKKGKIVVKDNNSDGVCEAIEKYLII